MVMEKCIVGTALAKFNIKTQESLLTLISNYH